MPPIISQILKITVRPDFDLDSAAFAKLREDVVKGGVKEQYYGMCTDERDKLFWVIHWPGDMDPTEYKGADESLDFKESVKALDATSDPSSWFLPLESADLVRPALTAPICELASIRLKATSHKNMIVGPLHKTFTDCYEASGFTGGHWSTAINDERMNYYFLGWDTRELHDEYAKTELFDLELNKIGPHMHEGTANFMKMIQQLN